MVLSAQLLGQAAVIDKRCVAQSSAYGPESRGTPCRSDIIISEQPIDYPYVTEIDILITLSQEGYDNFAQSTKESVFFDPQLVSPSTLSKARHFPIPATETASKELRTRLAANVIILSACAAQTALVSKDSLTRAIEMTLGERHRALNLKALELGWDLGSKVETYA